MHPVPGVKAAVSILWPGVKQVRIHDTPVRFASQSVQTLEKHDRVAQVTVVRHILRIRKMGPIGRAGYFSLCASMAGAFLPQCEPALPSLRKVTRKMRAWAVPSGRSAGFQRATRARLGGIAARGRASAGSACANSFISERK